MKILTTISCFILSISIYSGNLQESNQSGYTNDSIPFDTIYYTPILDTLGYIKINDLQENLNMAATLNKCLFIVSPSVYFINNDKSINIPSNVFFYGKDVFLNVMFDGDKDVKNIFNINSCHNSGILNLSVTTFSKKKDIQGKWNTGMYFSNKSIINIENSTNILIDSLKITRIFGCGVNISNSNEVTVSNSIINSSWVYGCKSGKQGYSINLDGVGCTNNFIYNNSLVDARHGIIIQYSAAYNIIQKNTIMDMKALKKVLFLEFFDTNYTFDLSFHGNSPHHNLVKENYCYGHLYIDDEKEIGNGEANMIISNYVGGRLQVDSYYPWDYNKGQVLINNLYGKSIKVKAKNCIVEGNEKIKK